MGGTCTMLVPMRGGGWNIHGAETAVCGKPSVYSQPCLCDELAADGVAHSITSHNGSGK